MDYSFTPIVSNVNEIPTQIHETRELRRINALPRRDVDFTKCEVFVEAMTDHYKTPKGEQVLRPAQAIALYELGCLSGVVGQLVVGVGKTLVSFLAPEILGVSRAALIIPAQLRGKTKRDFDALRYHWRQLCDLRIFSYQELASEKGASRFVDFDPQAVIADECHYLKNRQAKCTKFFLNFYKHKAGLGELHKVPPLVVLSGTITQRKLNDFEHLAEVAFPKTTPLPRDFNELRQWSLATDEKLGFGQVRTKPGSLVLFANEEQKMLIQSENEDKRIEGARKALQRRIFQTPGFISTTETGAGQSILIDVVDTPPAPESITAKHLVDLEAKWITPFGLPLTDGAKVWAMARQIALGFCYHWEEEPPKEWLYWRGEWSSVVRQILTKGRKYTREMELVNAIRYKGENAHDCKKIYEQWDKVRDSFDPDSQRTHTWLDPQRIQEIAQEVEEGQIVWVEHRAVGFKLAEILGVDYFANGGMAQTTQGLDIERACGLHDRPVIASTKACREGLNLQHHRNKNLMITPPTKGDVWEQIIGRTHREGQKEDEVLFRVLLTCEQAHNDFDQAQRDALRIEQTTKTPQKLCFANYL